MPHPAQEAPETPEITAERYLPAFSRAEFNAAPRKLLRDGRAANAVVWSVELAGRRWTVKDFSSRSWIVRNAIAPFLIRRELAALRRLPGLEGIAGRAFRLDRSAIAIEFVEGESLSRAKRERITVDYLEKLEALIAAMHSRGIVHLDIRGTGNMLIREDGTPAIIDFQSALATNLMPGFIRRILEDIDASGALKRWAKYHPEAMGSRRREELERINRLRRLWPFQGYFGIKKADRKA